MFDHLIFFPNIFVFVRNHFLSSIVLCLYVHTQDFLFFFTHDELFEHEPIQLPNPIREYLADENRPWPIDITTQTVFFHDQPLVRHEIASVFSKRDDFIVFDNQSSIVSFHITVNQQLLTSNTSQRFPTSLYLQ